MSDGPLRNTRILDLTHVWAGPLAVRFLADLGADVVKVEAPLGRGPRTPVALPLGGWIGGEPGPDPWNRNAIFVKLMRNRRSLCLDLKTTAGREALLALVAEADVLVENFSVRAMPSLGLGFAELRRANPRLIYVSMPGFGMSGLYRDRVAFGPTVEVMSGLTEFMGYGPDEPRNTAMALMDPVAAVNATAAVLTALRERESTGTGALVEMSLHEGGVSYSGPWLIDRQLGAQPQALGNAHPQMAPHGVYRCAGEDAWVAIACADDAQWRSLCAFLPALQALPTLAANGAQASLSQRQTAAAEIDDVIGVYTAARDKHAAAVELQAAGVSAGPVNSTPDMVADPQVVARDFFVPLEPGPTPVPGNPIQMTGVSSADWTPCPSLGADNAGVLTDWLGYSEQQVTELVTAGVLASTPPV